MNNRDRRVKRLVPLRMNGGVRESRTATKASQFSVARAQRVRLTCRRHASPRVFSRDTHPSQFSSVALPSLNARS